MMKSVGNFRGFGKNLSINRGKSKDEFSPEYCIIVSVADMSTIGVKRPIVRATAASRTVLPPYVPIRNGIFTYIGRFVRAMSSGTKGGTWGKRRDVSEAAARIGGRDVYRTTGSMFGGWRPNSNGNWARDPEFDALDRYAAVFRRARSRWGMFPKDWGQQPGDVGRPPPPSLRSIRGRHKEGDLCRGVFARRLRFGSAAASSLGPHRRSLDQWQLAGPKAARWILRIWRRVLRQIFLGAWYTKEILARRIRF